MTAYLICRSASDSLDTVVFSAGPNDRDEAVAVFTKSDVAKRYLADSGWAGQYSVATVDSVPLLRWLIHSHDERIRYLAIDPSYADQQAGLPTNVVSISAELLRLGQLLTDDLAEQAS